MYPRPGQTWLSHEWWDDCVVIGTAPEGVTVRWMSDGEKDVIDWDYWRADMQFVED